MRKVITLTLLIAATSLPHVALAQKSSPARAETRRRAEQLADRFVARFQQTRDFGIVWKAFRVSHPSCTHRANGILGDDDYAKLRPGKEVVEKLYIATMNFYYLQAVYELSLVRIGSKSEAPTPAEVALIVKRSKFFQNDEYTPRSLKDVSELIRTFDRLARRYRKHLPANAMKSAAWRANEKYLIDRNADDHESVINGHGTFCVPNGTSVYIVDRGVFYFYLVDEDGKMRVAGLGID